MDTKSVLEAPLADSDRRAPDVQAGAFAARLEAGAWCGITWNGEEILRGLDFLVRDEDWGTLPPAAMEETLQQQDGVLTHERRFTLAEGALACSVTSTMASSGRLEVEGRIEVRRDLMVNRAGFTLLHPLLGLVGAPLRVTHSDGSSEETSFPATIAPSQPAFDIAGLAYACRGVEVEIRMEGEVFEMEDQRNWSDASFKTYCRPLSFPRPYRLQAGQALRQRITLRAAGGSTARPAASTKVEIGEPMRVLMPEMLLAAEAGWLPAASADLAGLRGTSLLLRLDADEYEGLLEAALPALREQGNRLDLEIVLADDRPPEPDLRVIAEEIAAHGLAPRHVIALPRAFLKSHQPDGAWPQGLQPAEARAAARRAFPRARIGGGMLTNFTELNRHRPDPALIDYVTHGITPIVHAADDRSVLQTLAALPDIAASLGRLAGGIPWRLGLVAIGMRSNPYGAGIVPNPEGRCLPMVRDDPRAGTAFNASWALGAVAALLGAQALALAAPAGPFGILGRPNPLSDLVRMLADAAGAPRLRLTGLPDGVAGLAWRGRGGAPRLLLANLEEKPRRLDTPCGGCTLPPRQVVMPGQEDQA